MLWLAQSPDKPSVGVYLGEASGALGSSKQEHRAVAGGEETRGLVWDC